MRWKIKCSLLLTGFGEVKFSRRLPFLSFPYSQRNIASLSCNSTHLSPTSSCDGSILEVDALPLYYKHSCRTSYDSDDTKWHRRLILPILLDGDCIPLNASTWISTDANADESTVIPADQFFYTKVPRLCYKMDIPVRIMRNRDV